MSTLTSPGLFTVRMEPHLAMHEDGRITGNPSGNSVMERLPIIRSGTP